MLVVINFREFFYFRMNLYFIAYLIYLLRYCKGKLASR